MEITHRTVVIHPLAPPKVATGVACNGCGLCCLYEPCPLGIVLSRTRQGACHALRWDEALGQYRCGALVASEEVLAKVLPRMLRRLAPGLRRWAVRWIAAGMGCDSHLELMAGDDTNIVPVCTSADSQTMTGVSTQANTVISTQQTFHD
jgi:MinD superfamily P-loop ATPase